MNRCIWCLHPNVELHRCPGTFAGIKSDPTGHDPNALTTVACECGCVVLGGLVAWSMSRAVPYARA